MNEEIGFIIEATDESMRFSIEHLEKELVNIRAGKANPVMLKGVMIEYYGVPTPLSQVSNINTPDGRTILIGAYNARSGGVFPVFTNPIQWHNSPYAGAAFIFKFILFSPL